MRAMVIRRYGGPEVFEAAELDMPVAGEGQVLVRNHATVATPPDVAFRSADPFIVRFFAGLTRPKAGVLGDTISGEVVAVGPGVTRLRVGERVYGCTAAGNGAYAEYAAVGVGALAAMPPGVGFAEGAALIDGFMTAQPFIHDEAQLTRGQSILINGAAGAIGGMAVQLARNAGAIVTGVCSTRNVAHLTALGADRVIDRTREDFCDAVEAYDVIFDAVGKSSFTACREALKPGGIYLTTVPSLGIAGHMLIKPRGKRAKLATTGLRPDAQKRRDLGILNGLVTAGKVRAVIDRRYPLAEIADAHRYVETGRKVGSVVIDFAAAEAGRLAA